MCGRFALGANAEQVRLGVAAHFYRPRGTSRVRRRGGPEDEGEEEEEDEEVQHRVGRLRGGGNGGEVGEDQKFLLAYQNEDGKEEKEFMEPDVVEDLIKAAQMISWPTEELFRPMNWNVAPRSRSVVLRLRRNPKSQLTQESHTTPTPKSPASLFSFSDLQLDTMQWGLIPHWSKHPPSGPLNTINARSENLIDPTAGGMWQSLKGHKRCLVPVEGYYEWQKKPGGIKVPFFTRLLNWEEMDQKHPFGQVVQYPTPVAAETHEGDQKVKVPRLMFLAGLYDTVRYIDTSPDDPPITTFTILTTTPCASLTFLHDRMPVILDDQAECLAWLDNESGWTEKLAKLCRPYEGEVKCYTVQPEVGKIGNNSSSFVLPVAERKDGLASFFQKQVDGVKAESQSTKDRRTGVVKNENNEKESSATKATNKRRVHLPATEEKPTVLPPKKANKRESVKKLEEDGLDQGIGDDSAAPNKPTTRASAAAAKRVKAENATKHNQVLIISDDESEEGVKVGAKNRSKEDYHATSSSNSKKRTPPHPESSRRSAKKSKATKQTDVPPEKEERKHGQVCLDSYFK